MKKNLLDYQGRYGSEVRIQLIELVQCIALYNLGRRSDLKKLVSVALELLDNAQRYNTGSDVDFSWHIAGNELVVRVTNNSTSHDAERLVNAVEEISRMDPAEITEAFRRQMLNEGFGEKGGAGLGMLQIARKVGNTIRVHVEPLDNDVYVCRSEVSAALVPKSQ
ncbi:MAG: ATP-binding protein [Bacteroidetes bacterium]|nr:ATP-binding protein [Bacteroidota bacterium]MBS1945221.1 ATP-binding protein [Bacteroidota bacterium]